MSFRKKGAKVTEELLQDILWDVKQKFSESLAPDYLKKLLKQCNPIFHIVNRPKWQIYGQAYLCSKWAKKDIAKRQLKLKQSTHPMTKVDGEYYFLIIQINKGAYKSITRRGLRYLIAHELGHILQICLDQEVDGCFSFSTANDHDNRWLRLTKWMGGTGSEIIPVEEIWC
jgi:hypothetical protein